MKILAVTTKSPFPLYEGRALRTYNLLKETAKRHEVHLLSFIQTPEEVDGIEHMKQVCASVRALPLYMNGALPKAYDVLRELGSASPLMAMKYRTREMRRLIREALRRESFDLVHLDMLNLAEYIGDLGDVPTVLVEHNVESALLRRRVEAERGAARRAYFDYQLRKLARYEAWACREADHVIAVSDADNQQLRELSGHTRVTTIENGVDTAYFQQGARAVRPNSAVFVGGLTWYPNLDAMEYFSTRVLPLIVDHIPDFEITVVGKNPPQVLNESVAKNPRIRLAGLVDDVRPYIEQAAVYLVPLRIGGGTRLKILDALACGKALISTSVGCEGLDLEPDKHLLVADDPGEFAAKVVALLSDPARASALGRDGRQAVRERYEWKVIAERLMAVYDACAARESGFSKRKDGAAPERHALQES